MMLEWLGHPETVRGAAMIQDAVQAALADPTNRTPDLGGKKTTGELGDLIANHCKSKASAHQDT
jgi:isocitrate/isopropylmalate dehydrogenase